MGIKALPPPALSLTFPSCITHTHSTTFTPNNPTTTSFRQRIDNKQWPALSRPPESPLVARLLASSSLLKPHASPPHPPVVSRSPTATSPVPSLSVRFDDTRSRLSSSSASFRSSALSVRLPRTSRAISASSPLPSAPSRSPLSHTLSPSSRTPTSAPSTPSVLPSSPRTSSLPAASAVSATKLILGIAGRFMICFDTKGYHMV